MKFTSKVAVITLSLGLIAHGGATAFGAGTGRGGVDDKPHTSSSVPSSSSVPEANHHAANSCESSHSPARVAARTARLNNVITSLTARIDSLNAAKATASPKGVRKINHRIAELQRDIDKTNSRIAKEANRVHPTCTPSSTTPVVAP